MPYDPRPTSRGGNRGIDEEFSRCAPEGKFRVVAVDTFDGSDWVHGDFGTREAAEEAANYMGGEMLKTHVYDEKGQHIYDSGSF